MLGGLAQAGGKALGGARFSLVNIVPATFLVTFIATLISAKAYTGGSVDDLGGAVGRIGANAGWAVVAIFGIFVLALVLRPFQALLVQLLEGHWERWRGLHYPASVATERHRRIQETTEILRDFHQQHPDLVPMNASIGQMVRYQRITRRSKEHERRIVARSSRYPDRDRLLPTLLGNAFRNAEDNAGDRYGLDLLVVAPRLAQHLSAKLDREISQSLDLIDTTAAMCVSFTVAALASTPLIWRWDLWSLTPPIMVMLAVLSYRGAVRLARAHGRLLATAFDLHRFDMIAGLHYRLPDNAEDEYQFNRTLSDFLASGIPALDHDIADTPYTHPSAEDKSDATGPSPGPDAGGGTAA